MTQQVQHHHAPETFHVLRAGWIALFAPIWLTMFAPILLGQSMREAGRGRGEVAFVSLIVWPVVLLILVVGGGLAGITLAGVIGCISLLAAVRRG